jgi:hypothetical protein
MSCLLCTQSGGSLASDSVVDFVSCKTFENMNKAATNTVGGAKKRRKQLKKKGGDCDMTASASFMDSYIIGPATVPSSLPASGTGLDYQGVQSSVLNALAQTPPHVKDTYHNIIYPDYIVKNNINLQSQL